MNKGQTQAALVLILFLAPLVTAVTYNLTNTTQEPTGLIINESEFIYELTTTTTATTTTTTIPIASTTSSTITPYIPVPWMAYVRVWELPMHAYSTT